MAKKKEVGSSRSGPKIPVGVCRTCRVLKQKSDRIDCFGTGMATCRKFGVRSWPQVKLFKFGKYEGEYYGAEDAYAIAAFMDGLVSQPETASVGQGAQTNGQAYAPAAPIYNPTG